MPIGRGTIRRYGSRGGRGGGAYLVATLPDADDAPKKTIIVRETDNSLWRVGYEPVDAVPAVDESVTDSVASQSLYLGTGDTDNSFIDEGFYIHNTDGWQYKPQGRLASLITSSEIAEDTDLNGYLWKSIQDSDLDTDDAAAIYRTDTSVFRKKETGGLTASIETTTISTFHSSTTYLCRGIIATEPTDAFATGVTAESYFNSTTKRWRIRFDTGGNTDWRNANPGQIAFAINGTVTNNNRWYGLGGYTNTSDIDTVAEVLTWLESNPLPSTDTFFYDEDAGEIKQIDSHTASTDWEDATFAELFGDAAENLGYGIDGGQVLVALESEYDSDITYYYFKSNDDNKLFKVSNFTLKVEWRDAEPDEFFGTDEVWIEPTHAEDRWYPNASTGLDTAALIAAYLDGEDADGNERYDDTQTYYYYSTSNGLRVVDTFTAYVPEVPAYDREIYEQLNTEGNITLGPTTHIFASETARDAYGTANSAWLDAYDNDPTFLIQVTVNGNVGWQRRWEDDWQDVSRIIQGPAGTDATSLSKASESEAEAGTGTTIKGWTALLIKTAIDALSPVVSWAKTDSTEKIPADKITLPATASTAESKAGTVTEVRSFTPERVKEAIEALAPILPWAKIGNNDPIPAEKISASLSTQPVSVGRELTNELVSVERELTHTIGTETDLPLSIELSAINSVADNDFLAISANANLQATEDTVVQFPEVLSVLLNSITLTIDTDIAYTFSIVLEARNLTEEGEWIRVLESSPTTINASGTLVHQSTFSGTGKAFLLTNGDELEFRLNANASEDKITAVSGATLAEIPLVSVKENTGKKLQISDDGKIQIVNPEGTITDIVDADNTISSIPAEVTAQEITDATESESRLWSPRRVKDAIDTHAMTISSVAEVLAETNLRVRIPPDPAVNSNLPIPLPVEDLRNVPVGFFEKTDNDKIRFIYDTDITQDSRFDPQIRVTAQPVDTTFEGRLVIQMRYTQSDGTQSDWTALYSSGVIMRDAAGAFESSGQFFGVVYDNFSIPADSTLEFRLAADATQGNLEIISRTTVIWIRFNVAISGIDNRYIDVNPKGEVVVGDGEDDEVAITHPNRKVQLGYDPHVEKAYDLLWQAGNADSSRLATYNTASGSELSLATDKHFSNYATIVFWYDSGSSLHGSFDNVPYVIFDRLSGGGGYVQLNTNNGMLNVQKSSDTQFVLGDGLNVGLRKIYGIESKDIAGL